MQNAKILWADDEIELLKPHILFLEAKGMNILSVSNGMDAVEAVKQDTFDIVFLDENMPGMSGLEALSEIKNISPHTPVVMITKSEEEAIMEDAIGSKISDYLIKPVNPSQILLACKKILQNKELVTQKANSNYQQEFRKISMQFYEPLDHKDWVEIYKKLTYWDRQLEENEDKSMLEVLQNQFAEANNNFARFVMDNYLDWLHESDPEERPMLSPEIMKRTVFPKLKKTEESTFFILIDCLRYDQWKEFELILADYFYIASENQYFSILPTATQYARNAIFSGLYPLQIQKKFPKYWKDDADEGGKNNFEAELLRENIMAARLDIRHSYHKVLRNEEGKALVDNLGNLMQNDLNVIVYNFIDSLSHSRTDNRIIRELAPSTAAYRAVSRSWLEHSNLLELLKKLADKNVRVVITTDHGTVKVNKPVRIVGDRETTTNLRYKQGRNLSYDNSKYLFTIRDPEEAFLPRSTVSASYVFTTEDYFFAYPNNYNHYVKHFRDTLQHGGISMEEMICPIVELLPKR